MNYFRIIFILFFITTSSRAYTLDASRQQLIEQLKQRKILFDQYSASLAKKSGFFGNKTKNDLRESQEKLVQIIAADNKIMSSLNRTLDFRNYEKQSLSYDASSFEDRIRNLNVLNDTLNKKSLALIDENKQYRTAINHHYLYFGILILLLILTSYCCLRKYFIR